MTKNAHPSLLSFTASIDPSVFPMYAVHKEGDKEIINPIPVTTTTVRGTISNHAVDDIDTALEKQEKSPKNPNIQRIEIAHLPAESETLLIQGSINFLPNSLSPHACNEDEFAECHRKLVETYVSKGGYTVLAERYFMNIINGKILWRNGYGKNIETTVEMNGEGYTFLLADIEGNHPLSVEDIKKDEAKQAAKRMIEQIVEVFEGKKGLTTCLPVFVSARSTLGKGQDVYPSQEFSERDSKDQAGNPISKVLAKLKTRSHIDQAVIHSQKIGNAIRTIDDWYEDATYPLAVEPYGVDQSVQKARRVKDHLYKHLVDLGKLTEQIEKETIVPDNAHFVMACFIRGGVFSRAKENAKNKKS